MPISTPTGSDCVPDTPAFESPLVKTYRHATTAGLTLSDRSSMHKTIVRAGPDSYAAAQLGADFGSSRTLDDVLICGQRPGEWVLLGTTAAIDDLVGLLDRTGEVSVIDYTHSRALFRLTGDDAPSALAKVCGLDWSDEMTPDGAVTSGSVAKVNTDVVRDDQEGSRSYLISCDRSFGQYLFDALLDAGDEFTISPAP
jgi:sarcosine oxidase subunit alpha